MTYVHDVHILIGNMNYTVSVSDFRKDISKFTSIVNEGKTVTVNNGKSGVPLFKVVKADEDKFDWDEYMKFLDEIGGSGLFASKEDDLARKKFRKDLDKRFKIARNR